MAETRHKKVQPKTVIQRIESGLVPADAEDNIRSGEH